MSATVPAVASAPTRPRRSAFAMLVRSEARLLLRERVAIFWAVAFPLVLLVILGTVGGRKPRHDLGNLSVVGAYVPIDCALILALIGVNILPQWIGTYRERGVLRRMAVTPVAPSRVLAAQMVVNLVAAACSLVLLFGVGRIAFDVGLPSQVGGFLLVLVLTAVALFSVGLLLAAVAPSGRMAGGIGTVLFFPLMFFAGLWIPRASMPRVLRGVSDGTPLGAAVQGIQDTTMAGHFPQALSLGVLAAYAVVFGALAVRFFRWE